MAVSMGKIV